MRFRDEEPETEVPWDHCVQCGEGIYEKPFGVPRCRACRIAKFGVV